MSGGTGGGTSMGSGGTSGGMSGDQELSTVEEPIQETHVSASHSCFCKPL